MAKQNYTDAMTLEAGTLYAELGNEGLQKIADRMNEMQREAELGGDIKTVASVRSKLVKERIYVKSDKPNRVAKKEGPSKKDLVAQLIKLTGRENEGGEPFKGIDGITKPALQEIIEEFEKVLQVE